MPHQLSDEVRYRLLTYVAEHPEATQRELAQELGVSVGKVNYCIKALISEGWVKALNFKNNKNKAAYAYYLTPKGIEEKINVTITFLRAKVEEYDLIAKEIERLSAEVRELSTEKSA